MKTKRKIWKNKEQQKLTRRHAKSKRYYHGQHGLYHIMIVIIIWKSPHLNASCKAKEGLEYCVGPSEKQWR